jgi:hypothetical protein
MATMGDRLVFANSVVSVKQLVGAERQSLNSPGVVIDGEPAGSDGVNLSWGGAFLIVAFPGRLWKTCARLGFFGVIR